ncbi:MAG: glycosyltransferase family 2 protein [Chloroherpetonaceae bacterium]|nr:glycosyltransferase family 2 protein [Chloroherpetonaceae bacterium]
MNLSAALPLHFWEVFSLTIFLAWVGFWVRALKMRRDMPDLHALPPCEARTDLPMVSVIVPARNEAKRLRAAMQTLLRQTYPHLEIIAIDDRSSDATGDILRELAAQHPHLKFVQVSHLPEGWLGKNYANKLGYEQASGEYLLFTDADIFFHPEMIARTVQYARSTGAKHIVAYPKMETEHAMEEAFIALFGFLFTWKFSPSGARNPKNRKAYIGVGAFNFIERALYEKIGTHDVLKATVDDDVKLGYWVKQLGECTHVVRANRLISVRWREGLWDSLRGVERSAFPGINFSWLWVGLGVIGTLFGLVAPYWLFFSESRWIKACALGSVLMIFLIYWTLGRSWQKAARITLLHPIAALLFLYALIRSAVKITLQGGVEWRGTFYPVAMLRKAAQPKKTLGQVSS